MKQVIPFKKDIIFKTKVAEITSISLEHTLKLIDDDTISGEFMITGDYRITDYSVNKETFNYTIPFDIALNSKYNIQDSMVDVEDFYYEIINNDILRVNIDVMVDGIEEIVVEESPEFIPEPEVISEPEVVLEPEVVTEPEIIPEPEPVDVREANDNRDINVGINEDFNLEIKDSNMKEGKIVVETNSLFKTDDTSETFMTYKVYIIRENDTIDTILSKYNITKEELAMYNDVNNITLGEKIIIPYINNV